jgi:predicted dehydrogenase
MIAIKNKIKFIFLEKPISNSIKETIKILNILKKKKINFCINFIYPNIHAFKVLKKKILKMKIKKILYKWKFKQTYFKSLSQYWIFTGVLFLVLIIYVYSVFLMLKQKR